MVEGDWGIESWKKGGAGQSLVDYRMIQVRRLAFIGRWLDKDRRKGGGIDVRNCYHAEEKRCCRGDGIELYPLYNFESVFSRSSTSI